MSGINSPQGGFTRRSFLKTTAAAAGAAALAGGASLTALADDASEPSGEQVFSGTCRGNCMNGCQLDVIVRDGKIVRTTAHEYPYPEYNRACLRGMSHAEKVYEYDRLKYPLRRKGWSKEDANAEMRGKDEWERVSWEEAISEICDKWKSVRAQYGPHALLFRHGTGSYGQVNCGCNGAYSRLQYVLGVSTHYAAIDMNLINATSAVLGTGEGLSTNAYADMANAKTIIVWGANPTESQVQTWHFVQDAVANNGAKLVCVDPNFTTSAAQSDIWLPIRPGTDAFLACAMIKYLIDSGLADEEFLRSSSVAPFLLKEDGKYLRLSDFQELAEGESDSFFVLDETGTVRPLAEVAVPALHGSAEYQGVKVSTTYDGLIERMQEYTLEKAEEVCDVSRESIKEVVELYATNGPGWIYQGFGHDRWANGFSSCFSVTAMAVIAGQVGKSGASCGYAFYYGGQWRSWMTAYMTADMPEAGAGPDISSLQISDVCATGQWKGEPVVLKALFLEGANTLNSINDRNALINDMYANMEIIVVADRRMTDDAMYADFVLPAASWFEEYDLYGSLIPHNFVQYCEKAIEPIYECKSDFDIAKLLAEGMGHAAAFDGVTELDYLKASILPVEQQSAFDGPVTFERLQEESVIAFSDPYYVHGAGGVFPSQTGRAQFYLEHLVPVDFGLGEVDISADRWPHFEVPYEAWPETVGGYERNPLADKYPLAYYQEHTRWRVHSTWSHVPLLKELDPEPIVKMSRQDAEARGIDSGDIVKVYNDRGYCVLKARISDAQRPGQVNIPKGWHADQFIEGHYQNMTARHINPVNDNQAYFDALVEVELVRKGE